AVVIKLILPRRKLLIPGRAVVFLIVTMILAPGLMANVILKDHWGRPRPIDITQFGGNEHFVAWWDPRGDCRTNCAFVSGGVAGAFLTIAPAALAPPPLRTFCYGPALCLGTALGSVPGDGRRPFSVRCHLCRCIHVSHHLDRIRPNLSLAAHAPVGR